MGCQHLRPGSSSTAEELPSGLAEVELQALSRLSQGLLNKWFQNGAEHLSIADTLESQPLWFCWSDSYFVAYGYQSSPYMAVSGFVELMQSACPRCHPQSFARLLAPLPGFRTVLSSELAEQLPRPTTTSQLDT